MGAADAGDVVAAVEFAGERGWPVAVMGTGHGLSSVLEGGVLITTRRMAGVRIDARAGSAWLEAGVRWGQVVSEAARFGLAPLNGSAPHVGAVSYVLGGGLPLLGRTFGYAADRVRRMEVVTADGRLRMVSPEDDADLFFALLGGRDNFGVVTGLEIGLVPVARIYGGGLYFGGEHVEEVLSAWRAWTGTVPDTMNSSIALVPVPDAPGVPEPLRGKYVAHVRIAHTGPADEGERLVAPLKAVAPRLLETLGEMPYTDSAAIHSDPPVPMPWYAEVAMLDDLAPSDASLIFKTVGPDAPVMCVTEVRHLGGALARPQGASNAIGHRDARYMLYVLSPLMGPFTPETVRPVQRQLFDAVASRTQGRFLNFMGIGDNAGPEQVRTAYDAQTHERLTRLKAVHDPSNTFRANYNLPPTSAADA
nr:FAD-binding protein [Streptomyces canus]